MVAPETPDDNLTDEYNFIAEGLKRFGLTEYQARVYISLVAHGVADAETVAITANIPRTSVYKSLDSLHEMGYVVASEGRPRIYRPAEPLEVKSRLLRQLDEIFGRLHTIYEVLSEKGEPQVIYTIYGRDKVMAKISEILRKTQHDLVISTPKFSLLLDYLEHDLQTVVKRGVNITVITAPGERVMDGINIERRERLIATDIISDEQRALLASPGIEVCGYTNNPSLASCQAHGIVVHAAFRYPPDPRRWFPGRARAGFDHAPAPALADRRVSARGVPDRPQFPRLRRRRATGEPTRRGRRDPADVRRRPPFRPEGPVGCARHRHPRRHNGRQVLLSLQDRRIGLVDVPDAVLVRQQPEHLQKELVAVGLLGLANHLGRAEERGKMNVVLLDCHNHRPCRRRLILLQITL